jgi:hypothetical protein
MIPCISLDIYIIPKNKTENNYTEKDEIASSSPDMKLHPLSESRKRSLIRHRVSLVRIRTLLQNKVHSLLDKYHYKTELTDRHIQKIWNELS